MKRFFAVEIILMILMACLAGCGQKGQSGVAGPTPPVALAGTYVAKTNNGHNVCLTLTHDKGTLGMNGVQNQAGKVVSQTILVSGFTYTLVGTTVRLTGGTMTDEGRGFVAGMGNPDAKPGGDFMFLTLGDGGQSLTDKNSDGKTIKLIRQ